MEINDVVTAFAAGLTFGIVIGHWLKKQTKRLEYERGRVDGINFLWPHLVSAWIGRLAGERVFPTGDTAAGGETGAKPPVY